MTTETYRGVKIKVVALKGKHYGYCMVTINDVVQGREQGTEKKLVSRQHAYIDMAIEGPERMGPEWQPK